MSSIFSSHFRRENNGVGVGVGVGMGMGIGSLSAIEAAEALTQLIGASSSSSSTSSSSTSSSRRRDSLSSSPHCVSDDESSSSPAASLPRRSKKKKTANQKPSSRSENHNKPEMFPLRLHGMLSDPNPCVRETITWLPNGEAFAVLLPDVFAESVLPLYFPESAVGRRGSIAAGIDGANKAKYPSFTRKLNRWGFRQINKGPDAGAFRHPLFRRDRPELCRGMECQKSGKAKKAAAATAAAKEPGTKTTTSLNARAPPAKKTAPPPQPQPQILSSFQSSHIKVKSFESNRAAAKSFESSIGLKVKPAASASTTTAGESFSRRVPLKKRNFSHLLVERTPLVADATAPSTCSTTSAPYSASETPLLPEAPRAPRRVSSFVETATTTATVAPPPALHPHQRHHHHQRLVEKFVDEEGGGQQQQTRGQERNNVDFESTLHHLKASMERARAVKEAKKEREHRQAAAHLAPPPVPATRQSVLFTAQSPHHPQSNNAQGASSSSSGASAAEAHHKSMLYKAFLQAMQT